MAEAASMSHLTLKEDRTVIENYFGRIWLFYTCCFFLFRRAAKKKSQDRTLIIDYHTTTLNVVGTSYEVSVKVYQKQSGLNFNRRGNALNKDFVGPGKNSEDSIHAFLLSILLGTLGTPLSLLEIEFRVRSLWLVVEPYPSEKWWSESHLGWWHSQYDGKVIIPMFETTNQMWLLTSYFLKLGLYILSHLLWKVIKHFPNHQPVTVFADQPSIFGWVPRVSQPRPTWISFGCRWFLAPTEVAWPPRENYVRIPWGIHGHLEFF